MGRQGEYRKRSRRRAWIAVLGPILSLIVASAGWLVRQNLGAKYPWLASDAATITAGAILALALIGSIVVGLWEKKEPGPSIPPGPVASSGSGPAIAGVERIEGGVAGAGGIAARDIYGGVNIQAPPPPKPTTPPFQVPRDIPHFVGRQEELAELEAALTSGGVAAVCGVTGLGGIGKSALAAHFASLHRDLFPDGVLYGSLKDSDPLTLLASFARAYGEDVSAYPDVPTRAAAVRSDLTGKKTLVILDNAEKVEAVRGLLPCCGEHCAVLVTTRDEALAVAVATGPVVRVPVLSERESLDLLRRLAGGEWVEAEEEGAREVSALLGYLPLAVEIAGKMAALRGWAMGELLERLQDERKRLDLLRVKDLKVRTSFEASYRLLGEGQRTLFGVLGAFRGLSFDARAAAAVAEVEDAGEGFDLLGDLSLLSREARERFRQHPLLADFAREKLRKAGIEEKVLRRHGNYYLDCCVLTGSEGSVM